ncbi:MAG: hypothetical protein QM765_41905 [Myxococcales bacterium]
MGDDVAGEQLLERVVDLAQRVQTDGAGLALERVDAAADGGERVEGPLLHGEELGLQLLERELLRGDELGHQLRVRGQLRCGRAAGLVLKRRELAVHLAQCLSAGGDVRGRELGREGHDGLEPRPQGGRPTRGVDAGDSLLQLAQRGRLLAVGEDEGFAQPFELAFEVTKHGRIRSR